MKAKEAEKAAQTQSPPQRRDSAKIALPAFARRSPSAAAEAEAETSIPSTDVKSAGQENLPTPPPTETSKSETSPYTSGDGGRRVAALAAGKATLLYGEVCTKLRYLI